MKDEFFINSEFANNTNFSIPVVKSSTGTVYNCFYPYDMYGTIVPFDDIANREPLTAKYLLDNKVLIT